MIHSFPPISSASLQDASLDVAVNVLIQYLSTTPVLSKLVWGSLPMKAPVGLGVMDCNIYRSRWLEYIYSPLPALLSRSLVFWNQVNSICLQTLLYQLPAAARMQHRLEQRPRQQQQQLQRKPESLQSLEHILTTSTPCNITLLVYLVLLPSSLYSTGHDIYTADFPRAASADLN